MKWLLWRGRIGPNLQLSQVLVDFVVQINNNINNKEKVMSEFIFNDIYGSELAKQKYTKNYQFTYYNAVLKMHNKFYEDSQMHANIFNPRKIEKTKRSHDLGGLRVNAYTVDKLNQTTFKINKPSNQTKTQRKYFPELARDHRTVSYEEKQKRNIVKDAHLLKNLMQLNTIQKKSQRKRKQLNRITEAINKSISKEKKTSPF